MMMYVRPLIPEVTVEQRYYEAGDLDANDIRLSSSGGDG